METKLERPQVVSVNVVADGRRLRLLEPAPVAVEQRALQSLENDLADESVQLLNLPHQPINRVSRPEAAEQKEATLYLRASRQVGWMALDLVSDYVPNSQVLFNDSWYNRANCLDQADLFFPDESRLTEGRILETGIWEICQTCPVRSSCLETGLFFEEDHGVWGGYDYVVLARIRRWRRIIVKRLLPDYVGISIEALKFSRHTQAALIKRRIKTVGNLLNASDKKLRHLGESDPGDKRVFIECKRKIAALLLNGYSFEAPAPAETEVPARPDAGKIRHPVRLRKSLFNGHSQYPYAD